MGLEAIVDVGKRLRKSCTNAYSEINLCELTLP